MDLFQHAASNVFSSFASFFQLDSLYELGYVHETLPPLASFPQFARLPIEVRTSIWELSLEPRIIFLHLHRHYNNSGSYTMSVTKCTQSRICRCHPNPPNLPVITSVCCESRDVTFKAYSRRLDKIYDDHGVPITSRFQIASAKQSHNTLRTGVVLNPAVDIIHLHINIAYGRSLADLKHFAAIAAKELKDIRRVIVRIGIAMPPYKWWQRARFEKWRNWGADGSWVPRSLLELKNLREVVVLIEGDTIGKMLPIEWRDRTVLIWHEELEKMRQNWPAQWKGNIPRLRMIRELKEL